ncbi:hypothetical protein N181_23300 [Sinorhizobium fredii USDA 205]|uniref:Uncharacterized protein n=1 Tax=Rhizobium fredii TaxID=380 RepID=A0A844A2N7_RHIFR|nr:hypothetical protein [Sinorhizobium fredii]KSV85586.1 hypothetical protein N181_23300 [Sinorhizobium fredii USDA 205]MQX06777.1 hypothetical protein [Sinorhizobium fredii]
MTEFIEWKTHPKQEGFHGFLGEERICAVIPWTEKKDRWPWQLQVLNPALLVSEDVVAARTSDEAKHLAEQGVARFLQLDEIIPSYRNREVEQDRRQWLTETGWFDPIESRRSLTPQAASGRLFHARESCRRLRRAAAALRSTWISASPVTATERTCKRCSSTARRSVSIRSAF